MEGILYVLLALGAASLVAADANAEWNVDVAERNWTECSEACDGGERTLPDKRNWITPCHGFPCVPNTQCPCGTMDIVFVVDRSRSIEEKNYWTMKQYIMDIAEGLQRSQAPANTRFALLTFDIDINVMMDFSDDYNLGDLTRFQDKVWDLPYAPREKATATADGLTVADAVLTQRAQPHNTPVVIIITDGKSTQKGLMPDAIDLIHSGADRIIMGLGIGEDIERADIKDMTRDNDRTFMANDFDALARIVDKMTGGVCCEVAESVPTAPPATAAPLPQSNPSPLSVDCAVVQDWSPCSATCGSGVSTMAEECVQYDTMGEVASSNMLYTNRICCTAPCEVDECSANSGAGPSGVAPTFQDVSELDTRGITFQQGQLALQIDGSSVTLHGRVRGEWVALGEGCTEE